MREEVLVAKAEKDAAQAAADKARNELALELQDVEGKDSRVTR